MGLSSRQPVHARHRDGAGRRDDPRTPGRGGAQHRRTGSGSGLIAWLLVGLFALTLAQGAGAETLRIATYNAELSAFGPGLLLQDLQRGREPRVLAVAQVITALDADVLMLTGIDYDARGETLAALNALLGAAAYPHLLPLRPNSGVPTGRDLNGDGELAGPRDAQGYGRFAGAGGMAVLSRLPIAEGTVRDFSGLLWADLPGNLMPDTDPARDIQLLSSAGHYEVPVQLPGGQSLRLLAYYATPPAFDGPEDRNGRRNHDETAFWLRLLGGELPFAAPEPPFVLLGQPSLDPADGGGRPEALRALLAHPALQDPAPKGRSDRQDAGQTGDPALDTAVYDGLGGLRVEQVLPSAGLKVQAAELFWPPDSDPMAAVLALASRHRPVWVEVALP